MSYATQWESWRQLTRVLNGHIRRECDCRRAARVVALKEMLASWPEGYDEYGMWTAWSDKAKPLVVDILDAMEEPEA